MQISVKNSLGNITTVEYADVNEYNKDLAVMRKFDGFGCEIINPKKVI